MREEAAGEDLGRAGGGLQGGGHLLHTGEPVCLELPGPQEQALRGGWDLGSSRLCVGGAVWPSQEFQLAQCGGWAWGKGNCAQLPALTPLDAPRPSSPGQGRACMSPPGAQRVCLCVYRASPRECMPLMFVLGVHRGHENLPREANMSVSQQDMPLLQVWQPMTARPSRPGHLPMPGAPTVLQMGKPRPSGERTCSGLSGGLGQEPRHMHRTRQHVCSNTYTLAPLCAHTHLLHGHIQTGGPTPQLPSLGHTHPSPFTRSGP